MAFTTESAISAPSGNSGARNFFARAANANGFGSAAGSGITQSSPMSRFERNSRRLTTMQSSYTLQSIPWRQSPEWNARRPFIASTRQASGPVAPVFSNPSGTRSLVGRPV